MSDVKPDDFPRASPVLGGVEGFGEVLFGDTTGVWTGSELGTNQALTFLAATHRRTVVGDALGLFGHAHGGNDRINYKAVSMPAQFAFGDALHMGDDAVGGNDIVQAAIAAYGDALDMAGRAVGGDDLIYAPTIGRGDAAAMTDFTIGGNDEIYATTSVGDADTLSQHARGGNDRLYGTTLYGDAKVLSNDAVGGNDLLNGDIEYGDGQQMLDNAKGGDDVLVANVSTIMWGDAAVMGPGATGGRDTFLFRQVLGHNQIMDFEPGKDRIVLEESRVASFAGLTAMTQAVSGGLLITLGPKDSLFIQGVSSLNPADVVFPGTGPTVGGKGNDTLFTTTGNSVFYGRGGHDTFVIPEAAMLLVNGLPVFKQGDVAILDFTPGEDVIDFSGFGAGSTLTHRAHDGRYDLHDTTSGRDFIVYVGLGWTGYPSLQPGVDFFFT